MRHCWQDRQRSAIEDIDSEPNSEMEANYPRSGAYIDTYTVIEPEKVFVSKRGHVLASMTSALEFTSTKRGLIRHRTRKQTATKI